jgi:hypothetical protein
MMLLLSYDRTALVSNPSPPVRFTVIIGIETEGMNTQRDYVLQIGQLILVSFLYLKN